MADAQHDMNKREAAESLDAILFEDQVWDEYNSGPAQNWPDRLRVLSSFIFTLTHPTAIFYGPDLAMVHNQAWQRTARGALKQGFSPRHSLPDHTTKALRRALSQGQVPRAIVASELLSRSSDDDNNNNNNNNDDDCPVICSPIHDDKNKVQGVLVQIFLKTHSEGDGKQKHMSSSAELGQHHTSEESLDGNVHHEETALDRQPFFQKFAEMLPTGLAIIDSKAEPLFVNRQFHDLTAHRGPDSSFRMWPETIHPDDYDRVMSEYHNAFDKQTDLETEFRAFGDDQWRLFFMRPLGKNNLQQATLRNFGGYICALIDVSSIKNAELAQARAAKEAQERKQQQERFIDMISHEIRNPLSAILHCTEDIMEGLQNGQAKPHDIAVDDIVEAVRTISLCVDHQKNLVDDVLSFSKLDASMLSLAPRATRPKSQMADTLKIFQPELRKRKIEFSYHVETQYEDCQIDYVMADLVRISQVIVNLMTNAIKFTAKQESKKNINIKVAASIERPTSYPPDVVFFKTGDLELKADATGNPEWGDGAPLYIMVAIRDSGIGISEESQAKLFERFQQATPKTSADYGGSGLGLNIARKMCQLHGGEIGVHSAEGEGSTFGFFFRVRRSGEPEEAERLGSDELSAKLEQAGEKAGEEGSTKVADKHVPEDLKSISNENSGPGLGREPSKDRRQRTSDMADEMNKGNAESKLAGNRGQVSHSTAQDDQHQKDMEGRPANAGRSSERPSSTLEKRQSNQSDDDNKAAGVNGKSKGDEKNSSTDTKSDQRDGKSNSEDDRPRILYVEDNLINQKLLKRKIESKGFHVTTADNGREAIDIVQARSSANKRAFDCILMDQEMPIMNGQTASKEIRKFEDDNHLPAINIIGVSANIRDEQQKDMSDAGMNDYIAKPFKMEDLLSKIRRGSK